MTFRERLRALPAFARPGLPHFDTEAAPSTPHELFVAWLDQAIDAGLLAPHAALTFFWPELGRQVKVTGTAASAGPEASRADFLARPDLSRAAGLVNRQSEPLGSQAEYERAFAEALRAVTADPELAAPDWTAYVLAPAEVEFWQAPDDGPHTRLLYRADTDGWTTGLLWP